MWPNRSQVYGRLPRCPRERLPCQRPPPRGWQGRRGPGGSAAQACAKGVPATVTPVAAGTRQAQRGEARRVVGGKIPAGGDTAPALPLLEPLISLTKQGGSIM